VALATVYLVPFVLRARSRVPGEIARDLEHGEWLAFLEELLLRPIVRLLPLFGILLVVWLARLGWLLDRAGGQRARPVFAVILGSTMAAAVFFSTVLSAFRPEPWPAPLLHHRLGAFSSDPYGQLDHAVFPIFPRLLGRDLRSRAFCSSPPVSS
jgi:hypothetical protein